MLLADYLTIIRGGGDLATGVAYRLHKAGLPLIITELPHPRVVRRTVALASAVLEGQATVEDLHAQRVHTAQEALALAREPAAPIPVLVAPQLDELLAAPDAAPTVIVDARMAKRNIDTRIDQAPLVIALGPGFSAGQDCHAVVETMRGHTLGRVIWQGPAQANTGSPGLVAGKGSERVLRAPVSGEVRWNVRIGDIVRESQTLGDVDEHAIRAPFFGVVRGLIAPGTRVPAGLKIGDVDARADSAACHTISDKALAVGGGVLEAILTFINARAHSSR